jgi:predicted nucleic acid-binding protein
MNLIVDASVAVKWFFREPDSQSALALREQDFDFMAPDLVLAEIGNAAWKKRMRDEIDAAQAVFVMRQAPLLFSSLVPIAELAEAAMHLSATLRHPIYDCFYLALAERERAPIVSADGKLLAAAKKMRGVEGRRL